MPLYLFARRRLESAPAALVFAGLYLLSPAVHDINIVNEFHELAFAVPLLMLAFYAIEAQRWRLYGVWVLGALIVEDVALTVAALGLYLILVRRERSLGIARLVGAVVWFAIVIEVVMPALRGSPGPVPFTGYEYLGEEIFGMAQGIVTKPDALWEVMSSPPKREYLRWLLTPVAFIALLAPEVLLVTVPGLLLILGSTHPPTYVIFERYVAPVVPFVYLASVVGAERLRGITVHILHRITGNREHAARARCAVPRTTKAFVTAGVLVILVAGTTYAQQRLQKYPDQLSKYDDSPSQHAAIAMAVAEAIPNHATATIEDHSLLVRAAHRKHLYYLSDTSPQTNYVRIDRRVGPITHVPPEDRAAALECIVSSGEYIPVRCVDGVSLYADHDARRRDGALFPPTDGAILETIRLLDNCNSSATTCCAQRATPLIPLCSCCTGSRYVTSTDSTMGLWCAS